MVGKDDVLLSFFYRVVDDISWKWTCSRFFWTQIIEDFEKDIFKEKKKKRKKERKERIYTKVDATSCRSNTNFEKKQKQK